MQQAVYTRTHANISHATGGRLATVFTLRRCAGRQGTQSSDNCCPVNSVVSVLRYDQQVTVFLGPLGAVGFAARGRGGGGQPPVQDGQLPDVVLQGK